MWVEIEFGFHCCQIPDSPDLKTIVDSGECSDSQELSTVTPYQLQMLLRANDTEFYQRLNTNISALPKLLQLEPRHVLMKPRDSISVCAV